MAAAAAAIAGTATSAKAQFLVNTLGGTYTVDFDNTVSGVNNGAITGSGFQASPAAGQLDSDAWAVTGWSDGALAYGGTQQTASTDYTRGAATTAVSTGGMYAFSGGNITT